MDLIKFEKLVSGIVGERITLLKLTNQEAKKWYDKEYKKVDTIEIDTIYGVCIDNGSLIDFEFKSGKTIDSLLKTFITQYTTKRVEYGLIDGQVVKLNKQQKLAKIVEKNSDRVEYGLFYTTLYGIGMWDFFNSPLIHKTLTKAMNEYLISKGIEYKNEYSDAGWVYRYKFNLSIEKSNELLKDFKL